MMIDDHGLDGFTLVLGASAARSSLFFMAITVRIYSSSVASLHDHNWVVKVVWFGVRGGAAGSTSFVVDHQVLFVARGYDHRLVQICLASTHCISVNRSIVISWAHILPLALTTPKRFPQINLCWLLTSMATDTHDTCIYTIACIDHIRRALSHYTLHVEISSIYGGRAKIQLLLCLIASS